MPHRGRTQLIGPTWRDLFRRTVKLENGMTIVADEAYFAGARREPNAEVVAGYKPVMPTYPGQALGSGRRRHRV